MHFDRSNAQADLGTFTDLAAAATAFIAQMQHRLREVNGTEERELLEGIIRNAQDIASDLQGRRDTLQADVSPAAQAAFLRQDADLHHTLLSR